MEKVLYVIATRIIAVFCLFVIVPACTPQQMARSNGGRLTVDLQHGQKLVTVTWKEASLWVLTRPMREGERPEKWSFKENSSYGIVEGEVILVEHENK